MTNAFIFTALVIFCSSFAANASNIAVVESNVAFEKKLLAIKLGDTITFKNIDDASHQIEVLNSDKHIFEKGIEKPNVNAKFIFVKTGNYEVRDAIHPSRRMKVVVVSENIPESSAVRATNFATLAPSAGGDLSEAVMVK